MPRQSWRQLFLNLFFSAFWVTGSANILKIDCLIVACFTASLITKLQYKKREALRPPFSTVLLNSGHQALVASFIALVKEASSLMSFL